MRNTALFAACLTLAASSQAWAVPFFNSSKETQPSVQTAPPVKPESQGGWKMPKLWGKSESASNDPKFFYKDSTPPPPPTQRAGSALANNPISKSLASWFGKDGKDDQNSSTKQPDVLSLNRPVSKPTPELFVSMAQVREATGDAQAARGLYQQALAADPKNVETLREIGHFEDRQGNLADAERLYQQAVTLAPKDSAALNDLALCQARQGKLEPAVQSLQRAIELDPQKPLYRNNMATVLMEVGEQEQAMGHLMAAHPPAVAFFNMGHLLEKGGNLSAAAGHYAEAARLDPQLQAASAALVRVQQTLQPLAVPQTAMAPQKNVPPRSEAVTLPEATSSAWPWEPIAPAKPSAEPVFGPRLLPPLE